MEVTYESFSDSGPRRVDDRYNNLDICIGISLLGPQS